MIEFLIVGWIGFFLTLFLLIFLLIIWISSDNRQFAKEQEMASANTFGCIQELVGKKIIGVLNNTLPLGRADIAKGTKTFIFDDGTGFTFKTNGTFWSETKEDIAYAIKNQGEIA